MPSVTNRNVVPASISIGARAWCVRTETVWITTSVKDGTATREQAVLGGGYEPSITRLSRRHALGIAFYGAISCLEANL